MNKNRTRFWVLGSRFLPRTENPEPRTQRSFTLLELLITVTIFAVVTVAIYATFNSGMTVWRRAKDSEAQQRAFILKMEKLNRELRQAFLFNDVAFSGTGIKLQLASVIDSEIYRVIYSYDADKKALYRSQDKLADILAKGKLQLEPQFSSFAEGLDNFSFAYLIYDLQQKAYVWKKDWQQQPTLPLAVKVNVTQKEKSYVTVITIPTA